MGKDSKKKMCKWKKKDLKKELAAFSDAVRDSKFACSGCLRVAHSAKKLCHPVALEGTRK